MKVNIIKGLIAGFIFILLVYSAGFGLYDSVIPGPGNADYNLSLSKKARCFDNVWHKFHCPGGIGLDTVFAPVETPVDPSQIGIELYHFGWGSDCRGTEILSYGTYGDSGAYGCPATGVDAMIYYLYKVGALEEGYDEEELVQNLLKGMRGLHLQSYLADPPLTLTRGFKHKSWPGMEAPEPPCEYNNCWDRWENIRKGINNCQNGAWRQSLVDPDYLYEDETSRDQLIGYTFGCSVIADCIKSLPNPDPRLLEALEVMKDDFNKLFYSFRQNDWQLINPDGCPTIYGDIRHNCVFDTHIVVPGFINPEAIIIQLAFLQAAYRITDNPEIYEFYKYRISEKNPLAEDQNFIKKLETFPESVINTYPLVFKTYNFNMMTQAMYCLIKYEREPWIRYRYQKLYENHIWDTGPREINPEIPKKDPVDFGNPWFSVVYLGLRFRGCDLSNPKVKKAYDKMMYGFHHFHNPPYWSKYVDHRSEFCWPDEGPCDNPFDPYLVNNKEEEFPDALYPQDITRWKTRSHMGNISAYNTGGGADHCLTGVQYSGNDFRAAYWVGRYLLKDQFPEAPPTPTPSPQAKLFVLCAGYMDTRLSTNGGLIKLLALAKNEGNAEIEVRLYYEGMDTGLRLTPGENQGTISDWWLLVNLAPPLSKSIWKLELKAISNASYLSKLWPYLEVRP